MPFYFDYDLLLLAVPAVLIAGEVIRRGESLRNSDRWLIRSWMALGAWMLINPGIARMTHVNVTTMLLACLSSQLIVRACRGRALGIDRLDTASPAPHHALRAAA
jgi:hypothetical protein